MRRHGHERFVSERSQRAHRPARVVRLQLNDELDVEGRPAEAMRGNRQAADDEIAHVRIPQRCRDRSQAFKLHKWRIIRSILAMHFTI
jgi:hypothetical protein